MIYCSNVIIERWTDKTNVYGYALKVAYEFATLPETFSRIVVYSDNIDFSFLLAKEIKEMCRKTCLEKIEIYKTHIDLVRRKPNEIPFPIAVVWSESPVK